MAVFGLYNAESLSNLRLQSDANRLPALRPPWYLPDAKALTSALGDLQTPPRSPISTRLSVLLRASQPRSPSLVPHYQISLRLDSATPTPFVAKNLHREAVLPDSLVAAMPLRKEQPSGGPQRLRVGVSLSQDTKLGDHLAHRKAVKQTAGLRGDACRHRVRHPPRTRSTLSSSSLSMSSFNADQHDRADRRHEELKHLFERGSPRTVASQG